MKAIAAKQLPKDKAVSYIVGVLKDAGMHPTEASMRHLQSGGFWAIAPKDISDERVLAFEFGGLLNAAPKKRIGDYLVEVVPDLIEETAAHVVRELSTECGVYALVHEALLTEDELVERKLDVRKIENELYVFYNCSPLEKTRVDKLIRQSMLNWHFLAFFLNRTDQSLNSEQLFMDAKSILVGAYDGESLLYWRAP